MPFLKKSLQSIAILLVVSFAGLHLYMNVMAKTMLVNKLGSIFPQRVRIKSVRTKLPFTLIIKELEIRGVLRAGKVIAAGGMFDIFSRNFTLSELRLEKIYVNMEKSGEVISAWLPAAAEKDDNHMPAASEPVGSGREEQKIAAPESVIIPPVTVKKIVISESTVNYIDNSAGEKGIRITVDGINAIIRNLSLPVNGPGVTSFDLEAKIPWSDSKNEGSIELKGWADLFRKEMQANLRISDIDGLSLYPYYSKWVDIEKARIESAKLDFASNIKGVNNEMSAQCNLKLKDLVFAPRAQDEHQEKAERIAHAVIGIFKSMGQGDIALNFTVKTRMDKPVFSFRDVKTAFEDKIAQARKMEGAGAQRLFMAPGKLVEGAVKGATDITKAALIGTVNLGKELKDALLISFDRSPRSNGAGAEESK